MSPIFTGSKFVFGRVDLPIAVVQQTPPYQILKSLRAREDDGVYLSKNFGSSGNRTTWTWSGWVKRASAIGAAVSGDNIFVGTQGGTSNSTHSAFYFYQDLIYFGGWNSAYIISDKRFYDRSGWYHIVCAVDTNQSVATNRIRIYINNNEITYSQQAGFPSIGSSLGLNQTGVHNIGGNDPQSSNAEHTYSNIHFIDGQQLTPSAFAQAGTYHGQWVPKLYTGSYTGNSYWLNFEDISNIGKDSSGLGNNWSYNGSVNTSISGSSNDRDDMEDTQFSGGTPATDVNPPGNYCKFDQLSVYGSVTMTKCGTAVAFPTGAHGVNGTIAVKSGKWYWEAYAQAGMRTGYIGARAGFGEPDNSQSAESSSNRFVIYTHPTAGTYIGLNGTTIYNGGTPTIVDGDRLGFNLDADNNIIYIYKNGSLEFTYDFSSTVSIGSRWLTPIDGNGSGSSTPSWKYHFGDAGFEYTPRSGFKAISSALLATPITSPKNHFNILQYSGNGSSKSVTGLDFTPDLVWLKSYTGTTYAHHLIDSVRGGNKAVIANTTALEYSSSQYITSFNSDGFSLGNETGVNGSSTSYMAWCWKAGGAPTVANVGGQNPTAGSRMTNGSVDTSAYAVAGIYPIKMSTNTESGFSIVYYQGNGSNTQVPHGLSGTPDFILWKALDDPYNWDVYHRWTSNTGLPSNSYQSTLSLNNYNTARNVLHAAPTSTTIPVTQSYTGGADAGKGMIAYCWKEIEGYSRFGQYNGQWSSPRGAYVHCGFRPKFVIVKKLTSTESDPSVGWRMMDRVRSPFNNTSNALYATASSNQATNNTTCNFMSNGFMWTDQDANVNDNSVRYAFAAWAEVPQSLANGT